MASRYRIASSSCSGIDRCDVALRASSAVEVKPEQDGRIDDPWEGPIRDHVETLSRVCVTDIARLALGFDAFARIGNSRPAAHRQRFDVSRLETWPRLQGPVLCARRRRGDMTHDAPMTHFLIEAACARAAVKPLWRNRHLRHVRHDYRHAMGLKIERHFPWLPIRCANGARLLAQGGRCRGHAVACAKYG